ncbi:MAG: hypothetical protein QM676_11670 [Novosphingobium sp.]
MSGIERTCLIALIIVTALAFAVLSMPGLVVIGFFMLILPGMILAIAPAIALYGWLFAAPYAALRNVGFIWWKAVAVALLVPLIVGFGLPVLSNARTRANIAAAVANDIRPAQPLSIGGAVALVRDENTGGWHKNDDGCDDLCLRLLYNGDARIVYLGQIGRSGMAFTIERRSACPPFNLSQDVLKWHEWPARATGRKRIDWPPPPGLKEVVEARIAGGDCLVSIDDPIHDWTIERIALPRDKSNDRWSIVPRIAQGERITVYRHDGPGMRPVGRFTNAYASPLSVPLMPTLTGGVENARWTWGRTTVGESRWDWDSVTALRSLIMFNPNIPEGASPVQMRQLLRAALADPRRAPDDAGLLLANSIMVDIARHKAQPGDAELLAKAIADDRFTKIEPRYEIVEKLGAGYNMIVESAIARLGRLPESDATTFPHSALNTIIAKMPKDWFESPPADLTTLLRNPVIAARARGIIYKLDAGGAAAVPILVEIVTRGAERISGIEDRGYDRQFASEGIHAAVGALCRIGVPARGALGSIIAAKQKLIATGKRWQDPDPGKYSALWRGQKVNDRFVVTLVSLGVPIAEFRAPDHPSATVNGSWQDMIMLNVKDHDCSL